MRIKTPKFETKKELFKYLIENKQDLIKQKKSLPIELDNMPNIPLGKKGTAHKSEFGDDERVQVDAIGNLAMWYDSHQDVMLTDSWTKSITERGTLIPILKDHTHSVSAKIGKTLDVYTKDLLLSDLGVEGSEVLSAQGLIFQFEPRKSFDEKVYTMYKEGEINQHSIGLQYVKIELAVDDPDDAEEFAVWEKYYDKIINKDEVKKNGYFWAVKEAKILELSAVLFASNTMTPVLQIQTLKKEPLKNTQKEPLQSKSIFSLIAKSK